jgi:hypothetical protein
VFGSFPGSEPEVEVLSQVQRTRTLFSRNDLDAVRAEFTGNKSLAYRTLAASPVDDGGRKTIELYLNAFFAAIERDDRFYAPVVATNDGRIFLDPAAGSPACDNEPLQSGTPVSDPLEVSGTMSKVRVLNALWQWDGSSRTCDAVANVPVWIGSNALSREYPQR